MDAFEDRAPGEASGRAGGAAARCPSPPRGALDGIRKDHLRAKAARAAGETLKAGAAWSNAFLNQKSWHPLSYRNQKALFEAEAAAAKQRDADARAKEEFESEAEYFRNAAALPSGEQKKLRAAQSVSFMYQKPPGYDAMRQREEAEAAARAAAEAAAAAAAAGDTVALAALAAAAPGAPAGGDKTCARCGAPGHGLSQCRSAKGAAAAAASLRLEDPLTLMRARAALEEHPKFVLKRPMTGRSPPRGEAAAANPNAENQQMLTGQDDGAAGPEDADAAALAAFEAAAAAAGDGGAAALAALPKKARKALLKAFGRAQRARRRAAEASRVAAAQAFLRRNGGGDAAAAAGEEERGRKRRKKKHKTKRKRSRSRDSSSSSSSSGGSGS